jgi:hypothetical protein
MNELETALKTHDWSLKGFQDRLKLDCLMKMHADQAQAAALWEQYCPWSNSNGGYIQWAKK